jgi:tRNA (guanine26-N2/guanine27-N2)-dimethyltransferase
MASNHSVEVPDGFTLHTENTSHILLSSNEAFLNPVQEFNRDISVACIRTWGDDLNITKEEKWKRNQEKRLQRGSKKRFKGFRLTVSCVK